MYASSSLTETGLITKLQGGNYTVLSDSGQTLFCPARGLFRLQEISPMAGDRVEVSEGRIERVLPRKNEFVRPAVANVGRLILMFAASRPAPDVGLLDRMLVYAFCNKCDVTIIFNKCDLPQAQETIPKLKKAYAAFSPLFISLLDSTVHSSQFTILHSQLSVVCGPSGVGKSTFINAITNAGMETGELAARVDRGRHTTRHVELLPVGEGFIADTPGFSLLDTPKLPPAELAACYPEFLPYQGGCRFCNCLHDAEPGCAVKAAVNEGTVPAGRYRRYTEIIEELKANERY